MPLPDDRRTLEERVFSTSTRAAFLRFAFVGLTMAVIDAAVLYLLKDRPGFGVYVARLASYSSALTVGYVLNRNFTFHHVENERHIAEEILRFLSVHVAGGLLNLGIFSVVVYFGGRAELSHFWHEAMPLIGLCVGGVVGMCFNFALSRQLVFDA